MKFRTRFYFLNCMFKSLLKREARPMKLQKRPSATDEVNLSQNSESENQATYEN